ncbi:hypothetical protein [Paenibacillus lactis]|uniref:Uncharacterized protein n=1 Tax=Paenibacillus lactis 154 TaxID=743719 RepID=G4HNU4_9BACL|nr:hypothetical protein [Paenibacillus lactis]EHB50108.1 hypothetical protein PaelaDRAFT_5655 [Paenibacillus lactis 154]
MSPETIARGVLVFGKEGFDVVLNKAREYAVSRVTRTSDVVDTMIDIGIQRGCDFVQSEDDVGVIFMKHAALSIL